MDEHCETLLYNRLQEVLPEIEAHYGFKTRGVESMEFSWMPEACVDGGEVRCGNARRRATISYRLLALPNQMKIQKVSLC
ncbi:hypothetical protein D3C80_2130240 [compost metagenome]